MYQFRANISGQISITYYFRVISVSTNKVIQNNYILENLRNSKL